MKTDLKTKIVDEFTEMLNRGKQYPVDEMIEKHKALLGQTSAAKEKGQIFEREQEEDRLRSIGYSE